MGGPLVIVESPAKAKTIKSFLPKGTQVIASMGHVRDLPQSASDIPAKVKKEPWSNLGVNVESNFDPLYIIPKSKKKVVKELKAALADADELILATDEDREGESISWHLLEVLKPKVPVKRMVFHEITKEAIQSAMKNYREVDQNLVRAQEVRRILDRLVGYTLSPLLWKKIAYGLSAGRVQSVSLRLLVQRERERRAFVSAAYWDLKAKLLKSKLTFTAQMITWKGKRLATGKDFDENTGKIAAGKKVVLLGEDEAKELQKKLVSETFEVSKVEEKPSTVNPAPPFITSTLQQEANRKLRLSAKDTMRVAQGLYENGYITYMRTDSVNLSTQAIEAARAGVEEMYGKDYLSDKVRTYASKNKNAQEAHEAIRPAGSAFKHPKDTGLSGRELALYDMIWKRTIATQMAEAKQTHVSVILSVDEAEFRASGKRIDFPGFFRAYVENSDDPDAALDDKEIKLPSLKAGDQVDCSDLEALHHQTQPPARYTEASLVKRLDAEGIGRPSTYASIIGTIIDRGYVVRQANALVPTFTAFAVTELLENYFPDLVDLGFTAKMEGTLDEIASGDAQWLPYLASFYSGKDGLASQVEIHEGKIQPDESRQINLDGLSAHVRIGRYGAYLEVEKDGESTRATIPNDIAPADLNEDEVERIIRLKQEGPQSIGVDPETGENIFVLVGQYGPYVQLGEVTEENKKPKRVSLPKGKQPDDVDLDMALGLISLPRTLGEHPETKRPVKASIGRFGPYILHDMGADGKDFRSIKAPDDVLSIELPRALEMLAEPKKGRGRAKAKPLRELGKHPEDGGEVNVFDGPYGPYVKHDKTNASLPKDQDIEKVTLEQALELLAEKKTTKKKTRKRKS